MSNNVSFQWFIFYAKLRQVQLFYGEFQPLQLNFYQLMTAFTSVYDQLRQLQSLCPITKAIIVFFMANCDNFFNVKLRQLQLICMSTRKL